MIKFLVDNYAKIAIYTGKSGDVAAGLCFAYTKVDEEDPTFLFFLDGMKQ